MDFEKESINSEETQVNEAVGESAEQIENTAEQTEEPADELFEEGSTIFEKNTQKTEKGKGVSAKKRKIRALLSLILVAVIIAAGVFCAIKFIPEEETAENETFTIKVKTFEAKKVKQITVNNNHGKYVMFPVVDEAETSSGDESYVSVSWNLKDSDTTLLSETKVGTIADNILSIYATREMKDDSLDYGFDKPFATIEVLSVSGEEDYTVTVGNKSPDETGYYLKVSGDEKIYFVSAGTIEKYDFSYEDLANLVIVKTPTLDDTTEKEDKEYFDDEGTIAYFDYIEFGGPHYNNEKITINCVKDNEFLTHTVTTAEGIRYGDTDTCNAMFGIVTNGLVAMEAYKLNPTDADIKNYKLDNPELFVKIKYGTNTVELKASMYDTERNYYAVQISGLDAIYAVYADALDMLEATKEDYYNEFAFLEYYNSFSSVVITTGGKTYNFKTSYNEDSDGDEFTVELEGKKIDGDLFRAYYEHIVTIAPVVKDNYADGEADYKAVFTFTDTDRADKTLELIKQADRRYLVVVDGMKMGVVSAEVYNNLVEYLNNVINNKGIPEP